MDLLLVAAAACAASALTLVTGFGLGTLLMPVFALFMPAPLAVAATAVVHLANNLFKGALLLRLADFGVALRFGLPAIAGALLGAALLASLAGQAEPLWEWRLAGLHGRVSAGSLVLGLLVLTFAVLEIHPLRHRLSVPRRFLALGGLASGFLGGLSGHQGAVRAVFLRRLGLSPGCFAATAAMVAIGVDLARLAVYGASALHRAAGVPDALLMAGCAGALAGSVLGRRLLGRITAPALDRLVSALLALIGIGLLTGLI